MTTETVWKEGAVVHVALDDGGPRAMRVARMQRTGPNTTEVRLEVVGKEYVAKESVLPVGVPWCAICHRPVEQVGAQNNYDHPTAPSWVVSRSVAVTCHGQTFRSKLGPMEALPTILFAPLADATEERVFLARATHLSRRVDRITAEDERGNVVQIRHLSMAEAEQVFATLPPDVQQAQEAPR